MFDVSADLFNLSPQNMTAGGGDICASLQRAHVEHASFMVSLPYGEIHSGEVRISRRHPPGQEFYDDLEFFQGPSFGGIEFARSLLTAAEIEQTDDASESENSQPTLTSNNSNVAAGMLCTCHCPDIIEPPTATCFRQCKLTLQQCPDPQSIEAQSKDVKAFSEFLRNRGLTDTTLEVLTNDFSEMSSATRTHLLRLEAAGQN